MNKKIEHGAMTILLCVVCEAGVRAGEAGGVATPNKARFTLIDVPGAGTGTYQGTLATSVNTSGAVAGYYVDGNNVTHGFARSSNGTITTFGAHGAGANSGQGT